MKKIKLNFLFVFIVFFIGCGQSNERNNQVNGIPSVGEDISGVIKISGSSSMYNMVLKLSDEFMKIAPKVKILVQNNNSGKGMNDVMTGSADIAMVSRCQADNEKKCFFIPIAKDAVLPIISFDNYFLQEIVLHGITKSQLTDIFITGKIKTWGQLLKNNNPSPIKIYTRGDTSGTAETWANFLGKSQKDIKGTSVKDEQQMLDNISKDPLAIGYCSLSNAYNLNTGYHKKEIYILPIDFNSNKQLDDNEAFYDKHSQIIKAINSGFLPAPPARDLYFVCKAKPSDKKILAFIRWVITTGQNYIEPSGNVYIQKENARLTLESLK